ncbi:LysR substrate-binding domain-containing protein [Devosia sp.]|uniref:LysR substrate-binding domain-containing protein n=1 Tax=Devosia sp. TaxID=1871048 RepID=UPI003BA9CB34
MLDGRYLWPLARDRASACLPRTQSAVELVADGLRSAVLAGLGLAASSGWLFSSELASGQVRRVMQDWALPPLELSAVFPTGRLASAKARTFTTYIEQVLQNARTSEK